MLQLWHVASLCFYFLIPSLLCGNLRCYYRPILKKEKTFELVVTECPASQLCYKADGHYGNHTALAARGCAEKKLCGRQRRYTFRGTAYALNYTCCPWSYCNSGVTAEPLYVTVTLMVVAAMAGTS